MDMLEKLLNRKAEERLEELRLEKETELEKLRQQVINQKLELKAAGDEVNTLNKRVHELMLKLKHSEQDVGCGKMNSTELLSSTTFTFAQPQCVFNEKDTAHISMIKEERLSQSCFGASLKLEAEETTVNETTQQDETSCVDQTTQYETECEETECEETVEGSEDEDVEMETEDESTSEEEETGMYFN